MRITFVAIGDELLLGETQESNGAHLSQVLSKRGLSLEQIQILPDAQNRIAEALRDLVSAPGLVVVSGGLGPTDDDCTREAVAEALSVPLVCHEEIKKALANRKSSLHEGTSQSNLRQSYAPEGAKVLKNPVGTAPCFVANQESSRIFCLPGVPREFKKLIGLYLDELLEEMGAILEHRPELLFKVFGETESALQDRMSVIPHYEEVQVRSLPKFPEIWLRISPIGTQDGFDAFTTQLDRELGWRVFSRDSQGTYAGTLVEELKQANVSLALAESCTGGLISHMVTSVAGSSAVFWGSAVVYANEAKQKMLGVSLETIREKGAVSEEVARELAEGLRRDYGTTLGLSVTGIAGPDGGSKEKPVGTIYLALSTPDGTSSWRYNFPDMGRQRIQHLTAYVGIGKIRSWLGKRS